MRRERVEMLEESLENVNVLGVLKFLKTKKEKALYLFMEGTDDFSYYSNKISLIASVADEDLVKIDCGGKSGVAEACKIISDGKEYSNYRCFYFVDKHLRVWGAICGTSKSKNSLFFRAENVPRVINNI